LPFHNANHTNSSINKEAAPALHPLPDGVRLQSPKLLADIQRADVWKFIWLLPWMFFAMVMFSGDSFLFTDAIGGGFIFIRILIYSSLLLTCYLIDSFLRQVSKNTKLNEHARLMETQLGFQRTQYERLTEGVKTERARQARRISG